MALSESGRLDSNQRLLDPQAVLRGGDGHAIPEVSGSYRSNDYRFYPPSSLDSLWACVKNVTLLPDLDNCWEAQKARWAEEVSDV